jgi:hypothetical protein
VCRTVLNLGDQGDISPLLEDDCAGESELKDTEQDEETGAPRLEKWCLRRRRAAG